MRRHLQQGRCQLVVGWVIALVGILVYLLTLAPTVSFWDCGEFITTSCQLSVGHPPGAPLYQLLAHAFTWLAGGNVLLMARCSNVLSAVAAGLTVMILYWILLLLLPHQQGLKSHLSAVVGALCYLFCDTAWFSAVESEVYALAVLMATLSLWTMLRWYHASANEAPRWLLLTALLMGLGLCVHLLTLLVAPALLLLLIFRLWDRRHHPDSPRLLNPTLLLGCLLFFGLGLTPYFIIPIRAAVNPPVNTLGTPTAEHLHRYLAREQYEHAPLYPRIWRHHAHDQEYASDWSGGDNASLMGNLRYFFTYQVGYMYMRYLMWNFAGRYNDWRGYGSLQNGQFVTGIPPLDALLVGTGARPPDSLTHGSREVYFLLPLLLGVLGLGYQASSSRRGFWVVMTLFLFSSLGLILFLNHPTYEPRERDYAYVLSFLAFALWIGWGANWLQQRVESKLRKRGPRLRKTLMGLTIVLLLSAPTLMAAQNWSSHDRSHNFVARESALNLLNSCDPGALLFTMGDNDTFPLWYAQQVEGVRTDVTVYNVNILGSMQRFLHILDTNQGRREVFFSHYAYDELASLFAGQLQREGMAFHLCLGADSLEVSREASYAKVMDSLAWTPVNRSVDEISVRFLTSYWQDMLHLARSLSAAGSPERAHQVLDKTRREIPLDWLMDPQVMLEVADSYGECGDPTTSRQLRQWLMDRLQGETDYFHTMPAGYQRMIPFTIAPREEILDILKED